MDAATAAAVRQQRQTVALWLCPVAGPDGMLLADIAAQAASGAGAMPQDIGGRNVIQLDGILRTDIGAGVTADTALRIEFHHPGQQRVIAARQTLARGCRLRFGDSGLRGADKDAGVVHQIAEEAASC